MKVVVLGGGFAGFAAAIGSGTAARGRAGAARHPRRPRHPLARRRDRRRVDNGTHLMIGGYHATLDLLRRAGASDLLSFREARRGSTRAA
jgi:uncharacterized protein with NAD-binding domain and iron-sulfur cluster